MVNKKEVTNYVISQVNKQIYTYFETYKVKILVDLKRSGGIINLIGWLDFNNIEWSYPQLIYYHDNYGNDLTNYQNLLYCYLFNNVLLRFTDILSIIIKDPYNSNSKGIDICSKNLLKVLWKKINTLEYIKNEIDVSNLILVKHH